MNPLNPFAVSGILSAVFLLPPIFLIASQTNSKSTRVYCIYLFAAAMWGMGSFLIGITQDENTAILVWKFSYAWVLIIAPLFYHAINLIINKNSYRIIILTYLQALLFIVIMFDGKSMFTSVKYMFNSFYYIVASPVYTLSFTMFTVIIIIGHIDLIKHLSKCYPQERNQIRLIILATTIGFSGAIGNFIPPYGINLYPYGNFTIPLSALTTTYAILKHQLFEVNVVFKKSLIYSGLILFSALLYFGAILVLEKFIQGFWGYKSITISIVTAFVIGILFFPLHNRIQQLVDRIIFKKTTEEISNENEMLRAEVLKTEKLKSVAVLASGMAHEIKNPLTALKTFSEYLPHKLDDKEFLQKFSRIVGGEVNRIDQLVNELLEFARPAPAHFKPCNINKLITDTLDFLNSKFLQKNITVKTKLSPECNDPIMLDSNKMRQALLNIFLNAIDAMKPKGTLTVTVIATEYVTCEGVSRPSGRDRAPLGQTKRPLIVEKAKQSDTNKIAASPTAPRPKWTPFGRNDKEISNQPPAYIDQPPASNDQPPTSSVQPPTSNDQPQPPIPSIKITIPDTGCGIEKDKLLTIFDPFFSTKDSGTGLGLSITHGIIMNHGGEIKVASIVGQGTTFTLILPRNMKNSP